MERLKDAGTIAAKRGVRSAAVTKDRRLIVAAIALLDSGGEGAVALRTGGHACGIPHNAPHRILKAGCVTDRHTTKFTLRSLNEAELQGPNRLGNCLCRLTRRTVPRKKSVCRWPRQPHRRRLPCGNRWWYQDSRLERKSRRCGTEGGHDPRCRSACGRGTGPSCHNRPRQQLLEDRCNRVW